MDQGPMLGEGFEESQSGQIAVRMNWLRAGVMGANDGIVSTAGLVVGVAGAAVSNGAPGLGCCGLGRWRHVDGGR